MDRPAIFLPFLPGVLEFLTAPNTAQFLVIPGFFYLKRTSIFF